MAVGAQLFPLPPPSCFFFPSFFVFSFSFSFPLFFLLLLLFLFSFLPSYSSPCFFFFLKLQLLFLFHYCLLPLVATSATEANPTRSSSPCLLLLPHYSCSYAIKNQINQGHLSPLCLLANWRQEPCSQELKFLAMVVVALATIVIIISVNKVETK